MDILQQRIEHWSERLKLTQVATDWSGIATQAVKDQVSLGEFLEALLSQKFVVRTSMRTLSLLLIIVIAGCTTDSGQRDCMKVYTYATRPGEPGIAYAQQVPAQVMPPTMKALLGKLPPATPKDIEYCAYINPDGSLELLLRKHEPPTVQGYKFAKQGSDWIFIGTSHYGFLQ